MAKADALSRCMDLKKGIESDNKDVTLLKPEFFRVRALQQGHLFFFFFESTTYIPPYPSTCGVAK